MSSLHLGVNDVPSWKGILCYGIQQTTLCISGLLVYPFIVSSAVCAGAAEVQLRVQLIAATFVSCGIATLIQTTFGLRLSALHGPAMAFLPPLLVYKQQYTCDSTDHVTEEIWMSRMREIQGSLLVACSLFLLVGCSGVAGWLARLIGPITIVPLMLLLTASIVPTIEEKLALHWISILTVLIVVMCAVYLENVRVHVPYYSRRKNQWSSMSIRIFGQFPYLITIILVWLICHLLTVLNLEPSGSPARTDNNLTMNVLHESPWIQIPLPAPFGFPKFNMGMFFGYLASCLASIIENIGSYDLLARTSHQRPPPIDAINRAITVEGIGSAVAAVTGVSSGVTTYAENIALIHVTKVASRATAQMAGVILIVFGVFTKLAAILASIPDALVGGVLSMGVAMIGGVALSNLQQIDLRVCRNLSIMGLAFLFGHVVPLHFERHPVHTGNTELDEVLNMLLNIKMLVGGVVAAFLDNTVPGATREQRGFREFHNVENFNAANDAFRFPEYFWKIVKAFPFIRYIPIFPTFQNNSV